MLIKLLPQMFKKIIFLSLVVLALSLLLSGKRNKINGNLPLCNTKWILTEISNVPITHNVDTAYIVFYESYRVSGNFGCNLFFGEFIYGKKKLKIDYLGATKKYCFDMSLEEIFTKAIKNDITHYLIEKDELTLFSKTTVICKFKGYMLPIIEKINEEIINDDNSN
jgi:heat shock protein HslJ